MRPADEMIELERFQSRVSEVGLLDAWRELRDREYARGVRAAAVSCPGDCPDPLRLRFEHLIRGGDTR